MINPVSQRKVLMSLCILGVIAMICACVPEFENPLPVPKDLKPDLKIAGYWLHQGGDDESMMLHIYPRPNGYIDLHLISREGSGDNNSIEEQGVTANIPYFGFTTTINKQPVLCVKPLANAIPDIDESDNTWTIVPYYIDKTGILKIYLLKPEAFSEAVENKQLVGEADGDDVRIKNSSKQLGTFFADKNIKDFQKDEPFLILKKFADIPKPFMPKKKAKDSEIEAAPNSVDTKPDKNL